MFFKTLSSGCLPATWSGRRGKNQAEKTTKTQSTIASLQNHLSLSKVKPLSSTCTLFKRQSLGWSFVSFHPVILSALHACTLWCPRPLSSAPSDYTTLGEITVTVLRIISQWVLGLHTVFEITAFLLKEWVLTREANCNFILHAIVLLHILFRLNCFHYHWICHLDSLRY